MTATESASAPALATRAAGSGVNRERIAYRDLGVEQLLLSWSFN